MTNSQTYLLFSRKDLRVNVISRNFIIKINIYIRKSIFYFYSDYLHTKNDHNFGIFLENHNFGM